MSGVGTPATTETDADTGGPERLEADMLLDVRDLHTYYKGGGGIVRAVDGVSFQVGVGSSIGIVGESGSGKSSASLSIMGLIDEPGFIAAGQILFKGTDLTLLSEKELHEIRGRDISMVFQDPMSALNPVYTVGGQVVETIRAHRKVSKAEALELTIELFKLVGIPAAERRVNDYPHNLSGGMCQRVTIAMALANEPDLLILDEPTTALDMTIQAQILELVKALRARVNSAVLLITHDIGVVAEVCDEVLVMYGGKVMEHARVTQLIEDPKHPYTVGLLNSMPSLGMKGRRLNAIPGAVPSPHNMPPGCPFAPRCPHVMDICSRMPALKALDDGRQVACWLYK
jgi:oligopeptide/dipeptide ABC transporter ATP-binding protein